MALIDDLMEMQLSQDRLDKWYDDFVMVYHEEMSVFFRKLEDLPNSKNHFITCESWWCEDPTEADKSSHEAEQL